MKELVRARALELGFDQCRFASANAPASSDRFLNWLSEDRHGEMAYLERNASKRVDPQLVLPNARSVIALAVNYAMPQDSVDCRESNGESRGARVSGPEPDHAHQTLPGAIHGVIARYARFADYHDVLAEPLKRLAAYVHQLAGVGSQSLWYVDTGPILERDLAQRAGIGFVGKHTNVISRQFGNWIILAEILTTVEFEPDDSEKNRCGHCTRCIAACPTGAIVAPFQLDARLCISYLTIEFRGSIPIELRPKLGTRIFGCDDCLAACPWNRFARAATLMKDHARVDLTTPALIELLGMDESAFRRRFAGTPILRAKRRGFLRNVCVALGNSGDRSALPALRGAVLDPDSLIAEHAQWAIDRICERTDGTTHDETG